MNYSDYDSEDYSSNEDEDYVPSDDNLSEDDLNECVKEDGLDAEDQGEAPSEQLKKKKKKPSKGLSARKRKKGGLKLEEGDEGDGDKKKDEELKLPDETSVAESTVNKEVQQMKKADDLWATFLSDVGQRPKAETAGLQQITADSGEVRKPSAESPHKEAKATEASRITITKVYDFAGEAVQVTKEVDANSLEAKNFLKKEAKEEEQQISSSEASAASSLTAGPSVKRPAGMSSVLGRIGTKKAKMSTLEKSKLDWDTFKTEEGITEELAIHNRGKEGYVERKNFLERVDHRQFELEKNIRLSNMKR